MEQYRAQVRQGTASTLLGAVGAAAVALATSAPGRTLVPLAGSALVLLGAYYVLEKPRALAVAWPAPLIAAAIVAVSTDTTSLLTAAATLAVLSVVGALAWRIPAYFAALGRDLGR